MADAKLETPSKRRRIFRQGADKALDALSKTIKEEQHRNAVRRILDFLEKDPELAGHVLYMIETGKLREEQDPQALPATSNKFRASRNRSWRACTRPFPPRERTGTLSGEGEARQG